MTVGVSTTYHVDVILLRWPTRKIKLIVGNVNQGCQMAVVRTKKIAHS